MNPGNSKLMQMIMPTTALTAAGTVSGYVDTLNYDYLQVNLVEGSASAATQVTSLYLAESDTAPTSTTSQTKIIAFTGAAATSTSATFVLPTPNSGATSGNMYRFNVDLKGRKRYIGIYYQCAVSSQCSCTALLMRGAQGDDQSVSTDATLNSTLAALRLRQSG